MKSCHWFNLIITVIGLSQLDPWSLKKVRIWFDWVCIIRLGSLNSCCWLFHTSCVYCSNFLCSMLFLNIPILINCQQLIGVTVRPHTTSSRSKQGANRRLWPYHTPNDSPASKDVSFHVKGRKQLLSTSYAIPNKAYIISLLCTQVQTQQSYDCTTHQMTTILPMMQLCTSRNELVYTSIE